MWKFRCEPLDLLLQPPGTRDVRRAREYLEVTAVQATCVIGSTCPGYVQATCPGYVCHWLHLSRLRVSLARPVQGLQRIHLLGIHLLSAEVLSLRFSLQTSGFFRSRAFPFPPGADHRQIELVSDPPCRLAPSRERASQGGQGGGGRERASERASERADSLSARSLEGASERASERADSQSGHSILESY